GQLQRAAGGIHLEGAVDLDAVGGVGVGDRAAVEIDDAAGGGDQLPGIGQRVVDLQRAAGGGLQRAAALVIDGVAGGERQRLGADIGVDDAAALVLQRHLVDGAVAGDGVAVVVEDLGAENPGDGAADQPQLARPGQLQRAAGGIHLEGAVDLDAVGGVGVGDRAALEIDDAAGGGDQLPGIGQRVVDLQRAAGGGLQRAAALVIDGVAGGERQRLGADIGVDDAAALVLQRHLVDGAVAGDGVAVVVEDLGAENPGDGAADQPQLARPGQLQRAPSGIHLQRAVNLDAVRGVGVADRAGLHV